jgi:glycosyltransferase involved in cell wall biosynthesis
MERVPAHLLSRQIYFLGSRDDIESILQLADVGMLISAPCEGLSNSVIEYMAAGKPVIATEGGGTDELIQDGQNGFLVRNLDGAHVAEKLKTLMNDRALAQKMGQHASAWVHDNLDVRKMTQAYANLYQNLMNRKTKKIRTEKLTTAIAEA